MSIKTAITPTRAENYPEWYQQVIKGADLAESSGVRGCMVIKPWGYALWERIQRVVDDMLKATDHENCYFPIFIPLSYFQKEAAHVDGFAKEMAVVTHHRLINQDGQLVPDPSSKLEEPLIVRPTSETIIGEAMSKQIQSYRDLPLLWNQWANVVRWEMRTRPFLRTAEFLWQEGHTAHADEADAVRETVQILHGYEDLLENWLAMPVILGKKSLGERFAGAVDTYTLETMMQDGRALQAGTSHYLGQNFAKALDIKYQTKDGKLEFCHTTSWAVTTRLIGALVMMHADDDGLKLPPRMAPQQIVIVPIIKDAAQTDAVHAYIAELVAGLQDSEFMSEKLRIKVDKRDIQAGDKRWQWIKKGVPLIVEVGPKDMEQGQVAVTRRDDVAGKKLFIKREEFSSQVSGLLAEMQTGMFAAANAYRSTRMRADITDRAAFETYFKEEGDNGFTNGIGFIRATWSGDEEATETILKPLGVSVRCLPLDQQLTSGAKCVLTGKPAITEAIFARAY